MRNYICPKCNGKKDFRAKNCSNCRDKPAPMSEETKAKLSVAAKKRIPNALGRKQSKEEISKRMTSRYGYDTTQVEKTYNSKKTRWHLVKWAKKVKESWGNCCASCGSFKKLQAHHIMSKALFPELETLVTNGICLCHDCHWDLHRHIDGGV